MPRRPLNLTSPAASGVFLFLSAFPCNGTAQAPPFAFTGRLPSALPLSPFRPAPPRLAEARPVAALAVRRPPLVILVRPVPPCRFPCPVPPFAAPCGAFPSLPLLPALCRPRAAPEGRQPPPPVIPCRPAAVRRRKKVGFTNPR
jgi:hypothetical protein